MGLILSISPRLSYRSSDNIASHVHLTNNIMIILLDYDCIHVDNFSFEMDTK